ncbi:MAG: hypothetical protein R3Y60_04720 [bacterium]
MASKSSGISWGKILGFMAFVALLLTGINWVIDLVTEPIDVFTLIANVLLVGTVFLAGWSFVCTTKLPGNKLIWQIFIIVIAVLALCGSLGFGISK